MSLEPQPAHTTVTVTVTGASGLKAADSNGFSDPYVEVLVGDYVTCVIKKPTKPKKLDGARALLLTTPVIYKNLNPVWTTDNQVTINVLEGEHLWFRVWDKDTLSDDLLGFVSYGPWDKFPAEQTTENVDVKIDTLMEMKKGLLGLGAAKVKMNECTGVLHLSIKTVKAGLAVPIKLKGDKPGDWGAALAPASLHELANPAWGADYYSEEKRDDLRFHWTGKVRDSPAAYFRALVAVHVRAVLGDYFFQTAQSNSIAGGNAAEGKPIFQKVFDDIIAPAERVAQGIEARRKGMESASSLYTQIDYCAHKNATEENHLFEHWHEKYFPLTPAGVHAFEDFLKDVKVSCVPLDFA